MGDRDVHGVVGVNHVPSAVRALTWRLERERTPHAVAGWRIGAHGQTWVRLEAASWFLTGNLLVHTEENQVSLLTLVRYDRPWGRVVWSPLSAVHRRLTPSLLRDARSKVQALRGPAPAR